MSDKNCFCGGCGSAVFTGKCVCQSCLLDESRRGFSDLVEIDSWYYSDFDGVKATDFDLEVASTCGEFVETIMNRGFQFRTEEQELAKKELEQVTLVKTNWSNTDTHCSENQGFLGA